MKQMMTLFIFIAMTGSAVLFAADYQPGYSSSYALVVGIDRYHRWPHLEYAVKDAKEVAALLNDMGFQIYTLTDEEATKKNIIRKLEMIRRSVDANSRVVFFFAGHGQTEDLPGGRERGYIVPVDADAYDWKATMLPMNDLNHHIKQMTAKHIFMAFDSCYSGLGLTRSIKRRPRQDAAYIQKMMHSRSIQILTAGSRSEQAAETEGHGLFTDHLLAALSGAADINADGYVTATEVYATLRPSITKQSDGRQTPQFGYIEGNGDIIFFNTDRKKERSFVMIDSRIGGIDVWAGTSEIGRRLPAGRHRLATNAGRTTILVKKGGQTIYRENLLLRANQEFTIWIPPAAHADHTSLPKKPFSMLTVAGPDIENYSNSIAYDLDGDGREEIVTAEDQRLYAFRSDGALFWKRKFHFKITLNLIDDYRRRPAIGLTAVDDAGVHFLLLNDQGEEIRHHVEKNGAYYRGEPAGGGRIAELADIDADGAKEIIAIVAAEYARKPRGIIVYDQNARELWRHATGPVPQNIVILEKEGQRPDIILGTYSSGDGNQERHNDTDDMHAYVISIDGYGKTNWIIPVGTHHTGVRVLPADAKGNANQVIYAYKYTSFGYREDEGAIYKISRSGEILRRFESDESIMSMVISGGHHRPYLYAADKSGNLLKLDDRLNLLQKKSPNTTSEAREVRLVGVHDYDGDGINELLLYSFRRLLVDKNPLADPGPQNKIFYSNLEFQVLSQDFSGVIKSVSIAEDWNKSRGFAVKDLDRPESSHYPFMALSDKVTLYNY